MGMGSPVQSTEFTEKSCLINLLCVGLALLAPFAVPCPFEPTVHGGVQPETMPESPAALSSETSAALFPTPPF